MGFNKKYKSLFNVEILHHYFLDEGEDVYGVVLPNPEDEEKKQVRMERNLAAYDLSNYLKITPTNKTTTALRNLRSRFMQTKFGFEVATASNGDKPFIDFTANSSFDFIARINDPFFENYTDITIDREAPLFLSNVTPADAPEPEEGEENTAIKVRFCLFSEFTTDLTNGDPGPTLPMEEKDILLDEIDSQELVGAFAVIRIHLKGEAGEITLTNEENDVIEGKEKFNEDLPEVKWVLKNRSTIWQYHRSNDSVHVHTSTDAKPLTKNGFIAIEDVDDVKYPNPSVKLIYDGEPDTYVDDEGNTIVEVKEQKYSRIFI
ncbi:MAG: hypothetical protein AB8B56_16220 [Crocinitomicaceae bacterium]